MTTTDVATRDAVTQIESRAGGMDLDTVARLGMWLAAAESNSNDPKARGMAAALRIAYAGRLGLAPHAAGEIHIIKGNLTVSAKACRALAHRHGLRVIRVEEKPDSVTAAVVDIESGRELGRTTYTLAQAAKAGIGGGDNWKKIPDRMLWARASKRALDDHAPWVTVGVLTEEEVEDAGYTVPVPVEEPVAEPFVDADTIDEDEPSQFSIPESARQ